jgi:O-antigen/teichoic acid export membrane protein
MAANRQLLLGRAVVIRLGPRALAPVTTGVAISQLGVSGYADVVVALAVAGILSQLTELGMNQLIIREIHRGVSPRAVVRMALLLKVALIAITAVGLLVVASATSASSTRIMTIGLAMVGVWSATVGAAPDAALIGLGAIKESNHVNLIYSCASAVLPLLSLAISASPRDYLLSLVVSGVLYSVASGRLFIRLAPSVGSVRETIDFRRFAHATRWFAAGSFAEPLYSRLDSLLLAGLAGPAGVAAYSVAYTLFNLLWTASDLVATLQIVQLGSAVGHPFRERRLAGTGLAAALAFAGLSYPLSLLLLPDLLRTAGFHAGLLLAVAAVFVVSNRLFLTASRARGEERFATACLAAALGVNVAVNLLLDHIWGASGAAVGMITAELTIVAVARHRHRHREPTAAPTMGYALAAVATGCLWLMGPGLATSVVILVMALAVVVINRRPIAELLTYSQPVETG